MTVPEVEKVKDQPRCAHEVLEILGMVRFIIQFSPLSVKYQYRNELLFLHRRFMLNFSGKLD